MAKSNDSQIRFANLLKWIGTPGLDAENLQKVQESATRESNKRSGRDAEFLDSLAQACRIQRGKAFAGMMQGHIDMMEAYLKSVSPVHIDSFNLDK